MIRLMLYLYFNFLYLSKDTFANKLIVIRKRMNVIFCAELILLCVHNEIRVKRFL